VRGQKKTGKERGRTGIKKFHRELNVGTILPNEAMEQRTGHRGGGGGILLTGRERKHAKSIRDNKIDEPVSKSGGKNHII